MNKIIIDYVLMVGVWMIEFWIAQKFNFHF
jgi:hypothetical protein